MLETIQSIDTWLFHLLNSGIANSVFDKFFPFITTSGNWTLVYLFLFGWLLWKGGKKGRYCALALVITIIISDQFSSHLLKSFFGRMRPCHTLENVRLLVGCGAGKSFPSSHAVNNFAAAIVLGWFYRQYLWLYITIAAFIAFSRIYVGVHYPFDVLGGAAAGVLVGFVIVTILKKINVKYKFHSLNLKNL